MQTSTIASLRTRIMALERGPGAVLAPQRLSFGVSELDDRLPGRGLALSAVHEVFAGGPAVEHGAAPTLFAAGVLARRPGSVVWIMARRDLYPPALARAGLDPGRIVFVEARHGALRAMEESLRHPGLAGVVCEHEGRFDLTASRRLQLAAEATDVLGFVLRRSRRFDDPALGAPSAASTRWRITGLPSRPPLPHAPDVPGLVAPGPAALPGGASRQHHRGGSGCAGSSRYTFLLGRPTACAGTAAPHCQRGSPWSRGRMTAGEW